jgi:hypothetical protein
MKRTLGIFAGLSFMVIAASASASPVKLGVRRQLRMEANLLAQRARGLFEHLRLQARRIHRYDLGLELTRRMTRSAEHFAQLVRQRGRGRLRAIDSAFQDVQRRFRQARSALWHRHRFVVRARIHEIAASMSALSPLVQQALASIYIAPTPSYTVTYTPYPQPAPIQAGVYTTPGASVSWYQTDNR